MPEVKIDQLIRSRRKHITLIIDDDAKLIVRAPHHVPHYYIRELVIGRSEWIIRKQKEIASRPRPLEISPSERRALIERCRKVVAERCERYAEITGCHPETIRISGARTRWGSCGAKGSVNLNWRLILTPPEVLDYVIVHELCHLAERNHSKRFWDRVEAAMPDYKSRRRWLKRNGHLLLA